MGAIRLTHSTRLETKGQTAENGTTRVLRRTRNHEKRRDFFDFSAPDVAEIVMCEKAPIKTKKTQWSILRE